jgi:hypothetical protein
VEFVGGDCPQSGFSFEEFLKKIHFVNKNHMYCHLLTTIIFGLLLIDNP